MNKVFLMIMLLAYVGVLLGFISENMRNKKELHKKRIAASVFLIVCSVVTEVLYAKILGRVLVVLISEVLDESIFWRIVACNIVYHIPVILIRFFTLVLIVKLMGEKKLAKWVYVVLAVSIFVTVQLFILDDLYMITEYPDHVDDGSIWDYISVGGMLAYRLWFLRAGKGCFSVLAAVANVIINISEKREQSTIIKNRVLRVTTLVLFIALLSGVLSTYVRVRDIIQIREHEAKWRAEDILYCMGDGQVQGDFEIAHGKVYIRNLEFDEVRLQYYICAYNYNCQFTDLFANTKDFEPLTLEAVVSCWKELENADGLDRDYVKKYNCYALFSLEKFIGAATNTPYMEDVWTGIDQILKQKGIPKEQATPEQILEVYQQFEEEQR